MTTTTGSDISVVLSGGSNNTSPDLSLGGVASATPITNDVLNNLFSDVSADENANGVDDFRCIYFFNDGDTTIYSVDIFILSDFDGGATMQTGVALQDQIQRIFISPTPVSGSATFSYDGNNFVVNYDSPSNMALSIQNSLNSMLLGSGEHLLQDVVVTAQPISGGLIFDILFTGMDGTRNHPLMTLVANSFSPTVTITISITRPGFPINTIAPQIDVSTTPPGGVGFFAASEQSPISLPKLRFGDGLPIWIERVVPAGTAAQANDGLTLRFQADSLGI